ncbi:hypothetical protein IM538_07285 [Cytobacillus suaedae]|nr:hypothetical protein IM538_07285 [Cytobacillus suaedae]
MFAGIAAHMFILYTIGLTGVAFFIFLTGITIPRKPAWIKNSLNTNKNIPTYLLSGVVTIIGIIMLYNSSNYWRDIPYYRNQDYEKISGIPSSIEEEYTSTKSGVTTLYAVMDGKEFELFVVPKDHTDDPEQLKDKHFTFYYLPHSEWVIDYFVY